MSIDPELPELPTVASAAGDLPITEALTADAAASQAAESGHGHHGPIHTHCENCGTKLLGPHCHRCGQHDFEFHRSFRHVFMEALENFFHFEGKFFQNVVTLMFWPGRLTAEFNAGKRVVQMPPFRLYLFVSVLFFFLFTLGGVKQEPVLVKGGKQVETYEKPARSTVKHTSKHANRKDATSVHARTAVDAAEGKQAATPAETAAPAARAKVQASDEDDDDHTTLEDWVSDVTEDSLDPERRRHIAEAFLHDIPRLFLFCLPFFALYTRVLFRKSKQVYLQHLVLALHFHSFVYLWLMFRDGWVFLAGSVWSTLGSLVWGAASLWLVVYPFLMFRRLFGNSWKRTIFKTGLLSFAYLMTLGLGFIVMIAIVVSAD